MIPTPPRLTGDAKIDLPAVVEWAWGLYRELVVTNTTGRRLDAVASVAPFPDPNSAALPDVAAKVNAVITAAKKE